MIGSGRIAPSLFLIYPCKILLTCGEKYYGLLPQFICKIFFGTMILVYFLNDKFKYIYFTSLCSFFPGKFSPKFLYLRSAQHFPRNGLS